MRNVCLGVKSIVFVAYAPSQKKKIRIYSKIVLYGLLANIQKKRQTFHLLPFAINDDSHKQNPVGIGFQ